MNDSIKRISLDLHNSCSMVTVKVKRGDNGRKIYISLIDGGLPYQISEDCYAVFTGKKPDGNISFNDCTIVDNVIIYALTEQTTAVAGLVNCEIRLYGADAKLITSPKFNIDVDDTVYNEGDEVESSDEFSALTAIVSEATTLIKNVEDKLANGEFDGDDGHTPQKGIDYYTEAEKNAMVNDVLNALPKWEGGSY